MKLYLKFAAQVVAAVLAAIVAASVDNRVDFDEWVNAGYVGLGAVAVLGAGNLPAGVWRYTKTMVAAASAVLVLWHSLASGGLTVSEWLQLGAAALGAVGVYALPGPKVYGPVDLGRAASGLSGGPAM